MRLKVENMIFIMGEKMLRTKKMIKIIVALELRHKSCLDIDFILAPSHPLTSQVQRQPYCLCKGKLSTGKPLVIIAGKTAATIPLLQRKERFAVKDVRWYLR